MSFFTFKTSAVMLSLNSLLFSAAFAETAKKEPEKPAANPPPAAFELKLVNVNGSNGKDIVAVASGSKDHSTLVKAVIATDLVPTLSGPGPYTIFAPTNAAFEKLPKGTVEDLLKSENKTKLRNILEHHAAAPAYAPNILAMQREIAVQDGPKLKIKKENGKLTVNGIEITAGIQCQNGIIYVIDSVLP